MRFKYLYNYSYLEKTIVRESREFEYRKKLFVKIYDIIVWE